MLDIIFQTRVVNESVKHSVPMNGTEDEPYLNHQQEPLQQVDLTNGNGMQGAVGAPHALTGSGTTTISSRTSDINNLLCILTQIDIKFGSNLISKTT